MRGITGGKNAMGDVVVRVLHNGHKIIGRGASTDVIEASIRAYLNAINKILTKNDTPKTEKAEL